MKKMLFLLMILLITPQSGSAIASAGESAQQNRLSRLIARDLIEAAHRVLESEISETGKDIFLLQEKIRTGRQQRQSVSALQKELADANRNMSLFREEYENNKINILYSENFLSENNIVLHGDNPKLVYCLRMEIVRKTLGKMIFGANNKSGQVRILPGFDPGIRCPGD